MVIPPAIETRWRFLYSWLRASWLCNDKINKMQHYAGIYLLQNHSTCFGCPSHPSSGVHETVTADSGTGHCIWATTFLQRGLRPSRRNVVAQILWPVPETAVTVWCTPDDVRWTPETCTVILQQTLRWRNVVAQILWPVPEAAVTVWCTPDDGCDRHPKHVE